MNRSTLYSLLNFYWDYVPHFKELTEPIQKLVGQDATKWTEEASEVVKKLSNYSINSPHRLNMSTDEEARMESRISTKGISVLILQEDPEHK